MLKTIFVVVAALAAGVVSASATDVPVTSRPVPQPIPTVYAAPVQMQAPAPLAYDWTGATFGLTLGGAIHTSHFDDGNFTGTSNPNSVVGGLNLGYNLQIGQFVYGVATDVNFSSLNSSASFGSPPTYQITHDARLPFFGTARALGGFAIGKAMIYGTGGFAYGAPEDKYHYIDNTPSNASGSGNGMSTGWALGGGIQYSIMPNWTTGVEYMHIDLGQQSYTITDSLGAFAPWRNKGSTTTDLLRGGINYKW